MKQTAGERILRAGPYTAALALAIALIAVALPASARAATSAQPPGQGMLMIASDQPGLPEAFPLAHTDVRAFVTGFVAQVQVRQTFNNPFSSPLEAVYVFPLPQDAAVGAMNIQIGDRAIRGVIQRRDQARQTYERAKREGRAAALLDQERPNVFTQSVANIAPGQVVRVEIVYDVTLHYDAGEYEFVYPMVVGPRYIPGRPTAPKPPGVRSPDTDRVPDGSRISPPLHPPGTRSGHDVSIAVTLDPGAKLAKIYSPTHAIDVAPADASPHAVTVSLPKSERIPNKDLVVRYRLADDEPVTAALAQRDASGGYVAVMVEPPIDASQADLRAKEIFFVVDTSGSMRGEPMSLVKRAMRHALRHLGPRDTFQIVRFSDTASQLSPRPLANTPANVRQALSHINGLSGGGGTEMIRGIRAALSGRDDAGRLRIVCFMTDGFIGDEDAILSEIERTLDANTRLFALGVGSSVNRYLLDRMAEVGRGAVQYMLLAEPPEAQVTRFYERIAAPVLTHIEIDWGGLGVTDVWPRRAPDVFLGQPLAVVGRLARPGAGGSGRIRIRGRTASGPVELSVPLTVPGAEDGPETTAAGEQRALGRLWARAQIRSLMGQLRRGDRGAEAAITALGLRHGLVTQFTSFVAVDDRVVNPGGAQRTYHVPVEVPEGVQYDAVTVDGRSYAQRVSPVSPGDDDDGEDRAYDAELQPEMALGAAARRRLVRPGRWHVGLGAGLGAVTTGVGDDESPLLAAVHLTLDRTLPGRLGLGGHAVLLLPSLNGDRAVANLLLSLVYRGILDGLLELRAAVGPALNLGDGDGLGLGYGGSIGIPVPLSSSLSAGLELRYDGVRLDGQDLGSVTAGFRVTW